MSQFVRRRTDDPALDAGDLLLRVGLTLLAVVVPVSVVLSRRALFTLIPVGAGIVLLGGSLLPHIHVRSRFRAMVLSTPGLSGMALLAWCAVSLFWTPFPFEAAERLWKLGGTLGLVAFTIALLPDRTKTSNLYLFPIGLAAAAATTVVTMLLSQAGPLAIQPEDATPERTAISLVVLVWPSIGALAVRDRWLAAALLAVAVTVATLAAWTSVALAALAAGALTFTAATWHPARVARVLGLVMPLLFLLAPGLPFVIGAPLQGLADRFGEQAPTLLDVSGSVQTWAAIVAAEPLRLVTGHGFDIIGPAAVSGFIPPPVPHSLLFEAWYELGIVGAVSAAVFSAGAFLSVGRASAIVAPFLLAELVAGFTVALWGADTTQLWWITFLGMATVAFVHVVRGQYRTDRPAVEVLTSTPATEASASP